MATAGKRETDDIGVVEARKPRVSGERGWLSETEAAGGVAWWEMQRTSGDH